MGHDHDEEQSETASNPVLPVGFQNIIVVVSAEHASEYGSLGGIGIGGSTLHSTTHVPITCLSQAARRVVLHRHPCLSPEGCAAARTQRCMAFVWAFSSLGSMMPAGQSQPPATGLWAA